MRVFKSTYRAADGSTRKTRRWYVGITRDGRELRLAGYTDRAPTRALGRQVERLVRAVASEQPIPRDLQDWVDRASATVREKLAGWGLLDRRRMAAAQPLSVLLEEWRDSLAARGRSAQHVGESYRDALSVFAACEFTRFSQIEALAVERHLAQRRKDGASVRRSNALLGAARQFCRWMVAHGRAHQDPLVLCRKLDPETDRKVRRRALEHEEALRLLAATCTAPAQEGVSGATRALVYWLAIETGLRRSEIVSLTAGDFALDLGCATVTVGARASKRRTADTLPLRPELAAALRVHLRDRLPTAPAFGLPAGWRSWRSIEADLALARIVRVDESGRVVDFHSLRTTLCTWMDRAGISLRTRQEIARHSSAMLTVGTYTALRSDDAARALELLPELRIGSLAAHSAAATGTDGPSVSADADSANERPRRRARAQDSRRAGLVGTREDTSGLSRMEAAPGLEPGLTDLQSVDGNPPGAFVAGGYVGPRPSSASSSADELARVVAAWPRLSTEERARVLRIIEHGGDA